MTQAYQTKIIHPYNPTILVIDNFFEPEKCDLILEATKEKDFFKESSVGDNPDDPKYDYRRTSNTGWIDYTNYTAHELLIRTSRVLNVRPEQAEHLQVVRYKLGQEYAPHHDAFPVESDQLQKGGGQRIATALLYLNSPEEGGETAFPNLNIQPGGYEIQARKGRCVFFTTTFLGLEEPHPWSLHGAMPLIKGQKYVANMWFRQHQRWAYKDPNETDQSE
tara:strand:- start:564 stop:1223 length:660 start_codon:yes stop_codon:yes gene_type:complete